MKFKISLCKQCLVIAVVVASCIHIYFLSIKSSNSHKTPILPNSHEVSKTDSENVLIVSTTKQNTVINNVKPISIHISSKEELIADLEAHNNVTTHSPGMVTLPSFAKDESEYVFGSLIEREADSYILYLTTFFLCHQQLLKSTGHKQVNPFVRKSWNEMAGYANSIKYLPSGQRTPSPVYYCRIKVSQFSPAYVVQGVFVPNHLSTDRNSNQVMDILRCPLQQSKLSYDKFGHTDEEIHVDIMRDSITLISFAVPWKHRKAGFLLSNPSVSSMVSSNVDQWKGYSSGDNKLEKVHICIPGTKRTISKQVIPLFLEFISHHILLGASHIYLPLSLGWSSLKMKDAIGLLHNYIQEGSLSIVSTAGDELDLVQSSGGLTWSTYDMKVIHSNMCLYQAKGVAEYVMMLDIDEFFIPKQPHHSIISVIESVEAVTPLLPLIISADSHKPRPGWADGAAHPFCFLQLQSATLYNQPKINTNNNKNNKNKLKQDLIGERFSHGYKGNHNGYSKAILPTRLIYQAGLAAPGACALPQPFSVCSEEQKTSGKSFCGVPFAPILRQSIYDVKKDHSFYEQVSNADAKVLNPQSDALYYHFRLFQNEPKDHTNSTFAVGRSQYHPNEYSSRFFKSAVADLRRHNLHLLKLIDESESAEKDAFDEAEYLEKVQKSIQSWVSFSVNKTPALIEIIPAAFQSPQCPSRPIPNIESFSNRTSYQLRKLPIVTSDDSDYALGAMIERVSDSYDLYLTTFFMCQNLIQHVHGDSEGTIEKISPDAFDVWSMATKKIHSTKDHSYPTGERKQPPTVQCRITHAEGYEPYIVGGRFVPNRLTADANANRRLDIFRCKIKDTKDAYFKLARTDAIMTVEILKDGISVLKFEVPWKTRMAGYMLEPTQDATRFDAWKGFDVTTPSVWKHDDFYMCVPGIELAPSQRSLAPFLEFVQHHLLLGMNHMFIGVLLGEESHHMKTFKRVLQSFVNDGSVSIVSTAADGFDGVYSTHGLSWGRDNIKTIYVNMCTYLAKGTAEYVGVWDNDEFLIPRGNNKNIMDIIRGVEAPEPIPPSYVITVGATDRLIQANWKAARGLADKEGHPFCSILFNAEVQKSPFKQSFDYDHPWVGERYSHAAEPYNPHDNGIGWKKSIRPTRKVFMAGLHIVGACRLEPEWTPCFNNSLNPLSEDGFCWNQGADKGNQQRFVRADGFDFHLNHRFDEGSSDGDSKFVDHLTEGVIYHIQINRPYLTINPRKINMSDTSEYTAKYFPSVLRYLDERDLLLPITLPQNVTVPLVFNNSNWTHISTAWLSNKTSYVHSLPAQSSKYSLYLPQWSVDASELVLGAIIERSSLSDTARDMYLTTFLLAHQPIDQANGYITSINKYFEGSWQRFFKTSSSIGSVSSSSSSSSKEKYGCTIKNAKDSVSYYVDAEAISSDTNVESPVNILRCKIQMSDTVSTSSLFGENVFVKLHKGSADSTPFIAFFVPWKTRFNSKLLQPSNSSSTFNSWTDSHVASVYSVTAVTGIPPSKSTIAYYIEHVQHMINLGVKHIFLPVQFKWKSVHMNRLTKALRSFISDGLTITSMNIDGINFQSTFAGAIWNQYTANTIHTLLRVYFLKGITQYVALPEINQFFIPQNRSDYVLAAVSKYLDSKSTCSINFKNKRMLNSNNNNNTLFQSETSWIGHAFSHGAELNDDETVIGSIAVVVTENLQQLRYSVSQKRFICNSKSDTENIVLQSKGFFYQFLSDEHLKNHEMILHENENDYCKYYSSSVIQELTQRNLDLLIELPRQSTIDCIQGSNWMDYGLYIHAITD